MLRIYNGSLTKKVKNFTNIGTAAACISLASGSALTYKFQEKYQKWTWRQNLTVICASLIAAAGLANRRIVRPYVLSLDKELLTTPTKTNKNQFLYTATFPNNREIKFKSEDCYIPLNPGPWTSFAIKTQDKNNNPTYENVFINSDEMSYYDYKEMLIDAVREKLPAEVAENWKDQNSDEEFKALLGEMDKIKKEIEEEKKKQNQGRG